MNVKNTVLKMMQRIAIDLEADFDDDATLPTIVKVVGSNTVTITADAVLFGVLYAHEGDPNTVCTYFAKTPAICYDDDALFYATKAPHKGSVYRHLRWDDPIDWEYTVVKGLG